MKKICRIFSILKFFSVFKLMCFVVSYRHCILFLPTFVSHIYYQIIENNSSLARLTLSLRERADFSTTHCFSIICFNNFDYITNFIVLNEFCSIRNIKKIEKFQNKVLILYLS